MTSRPWTSTELTTLRKHAHEGAERLALLLARSIHSVKSAARRHRISLRPRTERRGKVLGEPRNTSLTATGHADIRAALLHHDIDPTRLAHHLTHATATARGERLDLCPACVARPIETPTGLCRVCHTHALTDAYRHATAEKTAERELVTERQRRHRRNT